MPGYGSYIIYIDPTHDEKLIIYINIQLPSIFILKIIQY